MVQIYSYIYVNKKEEKKKQCFIVLYIKMDCTNWHSKFRQYIKGKKKNVVTHFVHLLETDVILRYLGDKQL